ncbi:MAG: ABC transporter permease [Planctomycetota bacterium]
MLELIFGLIQSALIVAVPLLLAGTGELIAQRTGVINVGLEGLILAGCIGGYTGACLSGNPWLGLACAIAAGVVGALVFALATVWARADQIVVGMAMNLLAIGGAGTAWHALQDSGHATLPAAAGFARLGGPMPLDQYGLGWFAVALIIATWWMLARTRTGLALRALGEAPEACVAAGIDVRRWRTLAVISAGACAGLAGAYLSIMRTHGFAPGMSGGIGFLVLALVIFGRWRIGGLAIGCLGFGLLDAGQQQLQSAGAAGTVSHQLLRATPYLAALVALAVLRGGDGGPSKLGRPWPEER